MDRWKVGVKVEMPGSRWQVSRVTTSVSRNVEGFSRRANLHQSGSEEGGGAGAGALVAHAAIERRDAAIERRDAALPRFLATSRLSHCGITIVNIYDPDVSYIYGFQIFLINYKQSVLSIKQHVWIRFQNI